MTSETPPPHEKKELPKKQILFGIIAILAIAAISFGVLTFRPAYTVLIEPVYEQVQVIPDGAGLILVRDEQDRVVDHRGREIVPFGQFRNMRGLRDGGVNRFLAQQNDNWGEDAPWGVVERNGDVVIPFGQFDGFLLWPSYDRFIVIDQEERGIVDDTGHMVVPFGQYDFIFSGPGNIFEVSTREHITDRTLIDGDGNEIFPETEYSLWFGWTETLFPASYFCRESRESLAGVIDRNEDVVIPFGLYRRIEIVDEDRFIVSHDEHDDDNAEYALVDRRGRELIPFGKFDIIRASGSNSPFLLVAIGDDLESADRGIVDRNGREVLPIGRYRIGIPAGNLVSFQEQGGEHWGALRLRG